MRPTGRLHVGHYHGALKNWIALAKEFDCFYFSADWHALTTSYADPAAVKADELEMFRDWIAAGLDPAGVTLFVQSEVKEHAELHLLLSMITPLGWLERSPSYKEMREEITDRDIGTHGFLGYPVLQTADIAVHRGEVVPVGVDQVPHLEISREIVRRFNRLYGTPSRPEVLPEPQPRLTEIPKILGTDGRKMSKSFNNAVLLGEEEASAQKKIMTCMTDPARKRRQDPGNPEVCPIFYLHKAYSSPERIAEVDRECRVAGIGCVDCKKWLLEGLLPDLEKHRNARAGLDAERVRGLVQIGTARARETAAATMKDVREAMKI
jgi:tryptophanyl-tRNA synthetase